MAIILQISGGSVADWSLSTADLGDIERLRRTVSQSVDVIFGGDRTEAGNGRVVSRNAVLSAVEALLPAAKATPRGFVLRVPIINGVQMNLVAPGVGGALIGGVFHYVRCHDDYWEIQPIEQLRNSQPATRWYEPQEIPTENMGVIRVEARKVGRSGLVKVLEGIHNHVAHDPCKRVHRHLGLARCRRRARMAVPARPRL